MASISTAFTAVGDGQAISVKRGDNLTYELTGTYVGTMIFQKSDNGGLSWETVATPADDATVSETNIVATSGGAADILYRWRCEVYTSGTATGVVADAVQTAPIKEIKNSKGEAVFQIYEDRVAVTGDHTVSGNSTVTGTSASTGAQTENAASLTTVGVGAVAGSGVSVVEQGSDALHKTVITLTSASIPVTSTSTANGFGGLKVYDLPEGHIRLHGCVAEFTDISIPAADQADYTDATPEGDIGVGSVIIANADAMGTDATDDDMSTAAAFTMSAFAATANCAPEASLNFNGTSTATDVNVNVLVDAADIDDDVSTTVEVSGTITIHWSNLGDY